MTGKITLEIEFVFPFDLSSSDAKSIIEKLEDVVTTQAIEEGLTIKHRARGQMTSKNRFED